MCVQPAAYDRKHCGTRNKHKISLETNSYIQNHIFKNLTYTTKIEENNITLFEIFVLLLCVNLRLQREEAQFYIFTLIS